MKKQANNEFCNVLSPPPHLFTNKFNSELDYIAKPTWLSTLWFFFPGCFLLRTTLPIPESSLSSFSPTTRYHGSWVHLVEIWSLFKVVAHLGTQTRGRISEFSHLTWTIFTTSAFLFVWKVAAVEVATLATFKGRLCSVIDLETTSVLKSEAATI